MIRNRFVVECADTQTLKATISRLRNIDSVFDAFRVTPGAEGAILDFAQNAARAVLGPLVGAGEHGLAPVEERLNDAVAALHRAADSLDHHVEALETVADSLPALTSRSRACAISSRSVIALATPVKAVERDLGRIGRSSIAAGARHRAPPALTTPPSAPAAGSRSEPH